MALKACQIGSLNDNTMASGASIYLVEQILRSSSYDRGPSFALLPSMNYFLQPVHPRNKTAEARRRSILQSIGKFTISKPERDFFAGVSRISR